MIEICPTVIVSFALFHTATFSREERLWCYQCNTDLRRGRRASCNDPYIPGTFDLIACPPNESYHCHKSIVLYRNVLVTVRACVLSRQIDRYCDYEDGYPQSIIECYFCKENACNDRQSLKPISKWYLGLFTIIFAYFNVY